MRWDAALDDGRGEMTFGRPIRWILFLYGGRVVRSRSGAQVAQSGLVQEVRSAAVTYGHRFLATTGRAGRAIKVRTFDEYAPACSRTSSSSTAASATTRSRASWTRTRSAWEGASAPRPAHSRGCSRKCPTWWSTGGGRRHLRPRVPHPPRGGAGDDDDSPPARFFPVVNPSGRLLPAFLAVTNTQADNARALSRNFERVLTARLRDARFFFDADRATSLEARVPALETLLFHKRLGSYRAKAERLERLAGWVAREVFGEGARAEEAALAGRLAKADLVTDMVRELTMQLQGTMGSTPARRGCPGGLARDLQPVLRPRWNPTPRRRGPTSGRPPCRGPRWRWPASSTRSSASSRPASVRPGRATRWGSGARRTAS